MNIDTLRLFSEVARTLSFAAIAERRGTHPSSVSRAISQLEQELGARLLQRTTRRMTLTEAGVRFVHRVNAILDEVDAAREQLRKDVNQPKGRLTVTASIAFGERMIVPLVTAFREQFPKITLELWLTDQNIDLVTQGVDLAIRLGPPPQTDLITAQLMKTHYRVCASPGYLAQAPAIEQPADLSQHGCVVFSLPAFRNAWRFRPLQAPKTQPQAELTIPIHGQLAVSSALSLRSLTIAGHGPALLANWLIDDALRSGDLIDIFPQLAVTATTFDTAAWFLYPSRSFLPHKVRCLIDFLRKNLANQANDPDSNPKL